jgi:predicted HicB family RNase H-like nuclease
MMEHKGYIGRVVYDDDAEIFAGEVINTRDVITFQGQTVNELKQAFRDSVDDYLEFCAERGEEPEKPFSGRLMMRIPVDLHRDLHLEARHKGVSLNALIKNKLAHSMAKQRKVHA